MTGVALTLLLLTIGVIFGTQAEKRHVAELTRREAELSHIVVTNLRFVPNDYQNPELVTGSTVIAFDYFRRFIARLVMLVGGRITMYETMLDRARRQAVVRMLEAAELRGATAVHNVRFEFSRVGASAQGAQIGGGAELLAYGTAVR